MNKHIGTTLDSLFVELGEAEDVALLTQKKLLAEKVRRAMEKKGMTSAGLATAMKTSRTVVHRLLDPTDTGVTLATICKAENALKVKLVRVIPGRHSATG
jgi:ribosome-binding protein aMBF1 (putative translation factor)